MGVWVIVVVVGVSGDVSMGVDVCARVLKVILFPAELVMLVECVAPVVGECADGGDAVSVFFFCFLRMDGR